MTRNPKLKDQELKEKAKIYKARIPEYKIRKYVHFDSPIIEQTEESVDSLYNWLNDPKSIASHSFYPLISSEKIERRKSAIEHYLYYKEMLESTDDKEIKKVCQKNVDAFEKKGPKKIRPIRIAAHIDTLIYSHYSNILSKLYEQKAIELGVSDEVLAYRVKKGLISRNGVDDVLLTTATMYDVVQEIESRNLDCYVLAFDLSSFFDTIDHKKLKEEWKNILDVSELPIDHYHLFKSLTKYTYVDRTEINEYLASLTEDNEESDDTDVVSTNSDDCDNDEEFENHDSDSDDSEDNEDEEGDEEVDSTVSEKLNIQPPTFKSVFKSAKNFREFREWYRNNPKYADHRCFHKNPGFYGYGIPQGIQISGILSNIYMIPFDVKMHQLCKQFNMMYRRYCDDILIVLPRDEEVKDLVVSLVKDAIIERGASLKLHPINYWDKYSKSQCYDFGDEEAITKKPLQYLGYCYDGKNVRIREGSIAKYLRRMHRSITHYKIKHMRHVEYLNSNESSYIYSNNTSDEDIYKLYYLRRKKLYRKFTFRGKRNFVTYAIKSAKVFYGEGPKNNSIKSQIRSHCRIIKTKIDDANSTLKKYFESKTFNKRCSILKKKLVK